MSESEGAQRWLGFASIDLEAAKHLLAHEFAYKRVICYHAQQAAEKALKALLVAGGTEPPKTHNIGHLLALLPPQQAGEFDRERLTRLTVWATDSRYPGDMPEATMPEAKEAFAAASAALQVARKTLE